MVYRPDVDNTLCFVLMPFGGKFDGYYEHVIKPAIEATGLVARRADEIYSTGPIITDIWNSIWNARVIVADVTGKNANVNYELGLAHSLGVPTILLTQTMTDVPFDYRHRRCVVYDTTDARWQEALRRNISATLATVLDASAAFDDLPWPYNTKTDSSHTAQLAPITPYEQMVYRSGSIGQVAGFKWSLNHAAFGRSSEKSNRACKGVL